MHGPTFAPAPPAARPASRQTPKPPADEPNPAAKILVYLKLHWLTIAFCGTLLGAVLAYTAWSVIPTKYESYALLQVSSAPPAIAPANDPARGSKADFVTYLKTNAQLIRSELVLNSALSDAKYKIAALPTLAEQKDPIKFLTEKLRVENGESEIITVALEGERPDDVRKIVDAVKDAYYREVFEREIKEKRLLRNQVEKARTELEDQLKQKLRPGGAPGLLPQGILNAGGPPQPMAPAPGAVAPVVAVAPVAPVVAATDAVNKLLAPQLAAKIGNLQADLDKLPQLVRDKQTEVESVKKRIEFLKSGPPAAETLLAVDKDPDVMMKEALAKQYEADARSLASTLLNPDGGPVLRAKEKARQAAEEAKKIRQDKAAGLEITRRQRDADKLFADLDLAERQLKSLLERQQTAPAMIQQAKLELAAIPPEARTAAEAKKDKPLADAVETDIISTNLMYSKLTTQLIALDLELQAPPRIRKLQEASSPSLKDGKKQLLGTVAAGLLGFALIGFGAVAVEMRAKKVSALSDILGNGPPVVGVLPWRPDATTARDPAKRADMAEAVDKLRGYVAQTWLSRGATTVAVTSPLADEGKGFAAFALAASFAHAGYKTLLVDFDLRTPALHPLAGVPNADGVCELLRGTTDPRSAVQVLPNGLRFVPAGTWTEDARHAAANDRVEAVLAKLKQPFDCVVVHGHALLTAAEGVEVVRRCDVALLCSQYRETRLPLLKRAADRVAAMEIPFSGIVYLGATPQEALC